MRAGKYFSKEAKCFRSWLAVLGFDKCWLEKKRTPKSSEQICFQGGQTNCNLFFSYRRWSPSSKEGDLHLLPLQKLLASQNTIPGRDNTSLTPFFPHFSAYAGWNKAVFQIHWAVSRTTCLWIDLKDLWVCAHVIYTIKQFKKKKKKSIIPHFLPDCKRAKLPVPFWLSSASYLATRCIDAD